MNWLHFHIVISVVFSFYSIFALVPIKVCLLDAYPSLDYAGTQFSRQLATPQLRRLIQHRCQLDIKPWVCFSKKAEFARGSISDWSLSLYVCVCVIVVVNSDVALVNLDKPPSVSTYHHPDEQPPWGILWPFRWRIMDHDSVTMMTGIWLVIWIATISIPRCSVYSKFYEKITRIDLALMQTWTSSEGKYAPRVAFRILHLSNSITAYQSRGTINRDGFQERLATESVVLTFSLAMIVVVFHWMGYFGGGSVSSEGGWIKLEVDQLDEWDDFNLFPHMGVS